MPDHAYRRTALAALLALPAAAAEPAGRLVPVLQSRPIYDGLATAEGGRRHRRRGRDLRGRPRPLAHPPRAPDGAVPTLVVSPKLDWVDGMEIDDGNLPIGIAVSGESGGARPGLSGRIRRHSTSPSITRIANPSGNPPRARARRSRSR